MIHQTSLFFTFHRQNYIHTHLQSMHKIYLFIFFLMLNIFLSINTFKINYLIQIVCSKDVSFKIFLQKFSSKKFSEKILETNNQAGESNSIPQ